MHREYGLTRFFKNLACLRKPHGALYFLIYELYIILVSNFMRAHKIFLAWLEEFGSGIDPNF